MYDKNNPFAKILRKEIPCRLVFENDFAMAFWSIEPKAKVHILVIPKGEYIDISDFYANASEKEVIEFHKSISHVAENVMNLSNGYRVIANKGPDSGQSVFHLHYHILGGENMDKDGL